MAPTFSYHHVLFVMLLVVTFLHSFVIGDVKVMNFTQRLDHFNIHDEIQNLTFQQKFILDDSRWSGADSGGPIFALLGNEKTQTNVVDEYGILNQSATEFKGMLLLIEHRFYGDSIPLGSIEAAFADTRVRECLSTDQALEDFAVIIQSLRTNLSAFNSPVIVTGMGYGGALATWFRLKYPEIAIGALASSTPLLYYGNSTPGDGYCSTVSKIYQDINPKCHDFIRKSWKLIDDVASRPNGLKRLSKAFYTCRPLKSTNELKQWLGQFYSAVIAYDDITNRAVRATCSIILGRENIKGIVAAFQNVIQTLTCFEGEYIDVDSPFEPNSNRTMAWAWQKCTELIYPVGCGDNSMLLPHRAFDMAQFQKSCRLRFGEVSFPHSPISIFGTHDIKKSLKFGGNIIFSNGLRDPSTSGGILEDVSSTIVAINSEEGCYGRDFYMQTDNDPKWLRKQRKAEIKIFISWINHFHHINTGSNFRCSFYLYLLELLIFLYLY